MCGPSGSEKQLETQEAGMSQALQADFGTRFGQQSQVLSNLNSVLTPIVQAGPNQQGFSASQLAALNTQALDTTGANYANAARAVGSQLAGRSADSGLESGVQQQIKGSLASSAAGQLSNEELGITNANYEQGNANFNRAVGGAQALAGEENPLGFAGATNQANSSAFGEANQINQQQNQEEADIISGVTGLASTGLNIATGGISGLIGGVTKNAGFLDPAQGQFSPENGQSGVGAFALQG